ncbi:MAG TPA: alpha/beta hydrolase [Anaerolineales bacterium]|nr:alpha/beta hydrolase [Anaerolineales bacterium]
MSIIYKSYADTPEGQVHFRQLKKADGIPLVLLHQTASSGMMFEPLMTLLKDDFHTIAPDTPGFGASFSPPNLFTVQYLSDSLHAALTSLGVESCFLFGHHTGSALAVQMAFDHPNFVKKMILSGPPLLSEAQIKGLKASLKPFALAEDGSHLTHVWERIRKRDESLPLDIVHREVLLTQSAREAAQGAYQAVFDQPFGEQLATLDISILVMAGENDTLRASLEPSHELSQNGEMRVLEGAGPYICDTHPQVVAEILKSFLKE